MGWICLIWNFDCEIILFQNLLTLCTILAKQNLYILTLRLLPTNRRISWKSYKLTSLVLLLSFYYYYFIHSQNFMWSKTYIEVNERSKTYLFGKKFFIKNLYVSVNTFFNHIFTSHVSNCYGTFFTKTPKNYNPNTILSLQLLR